MPDEQTTDQVENQTPSQEDYDALKAELEAERQKAQTLVDEAIKPYQDRIIALEAEIDTKTADIEALKVSLKATQDDFDGARAAHAYAVEDYKTLAATGNPLVPAEAIYGTTIEEVKASIDRATALVAKVKQAIAEQAQAAPVPAGAPARTGPDISGMSATEKINYGLQQAKRRKD